MNNPYKNYKNIDNSLLWVYHPAYIPCPSLYRWRDIIDLIIIITVITFARCPRDAGGIELYN